MLPHGLEYGTRCSPKDDLPKPPALAGIYQQPHVLQLQDIANVDAARVSHTPRFDDDADDEDDDDDDDADDDDGEQTISTLW